MTIAETSRVGIGTPDPSELLHLNGTSSVTLRSDSANNNYIKQDTDSSSSGEGVGTLLSIGDTPRTGFWMNPSTKALHFFAHSTNAFQDTNAVPDTAAIRFTIKANGECGIGLADPAKLFHVSGSVANVALFESSGAEASIQCKNDARTWSTGVRDIGATANAWFIYDNGATVDRLIIDTSGRVGIGTTAPSNSLELESTGGSNNHLASIKATALGNSYQSGYDAIGIASGQTRHAIVAVYNHSGITYPAGYLRLDASDGVSCFMWLDNDDDLQVSNDAAHIGTTSGQEIHDDITTSDERLKDISSDAFPYGLSDINKLTPIRFKYKHKTKKDWKLGLGAQTTQPIVPETVKDTEMNVEGLAKGETKLRMSYSQFIPILIKAVQELSAKVEALENA